MRAGRAGGARQRHNQVDLVPFDFHAVDEPHINDIDPHFWVIYLLQYLIHSFLPRHVWVLLVLPGTPRANRLQVHFHEDIVALHLDWIGLYRLNRRHSQGLTRADIKACTVAWAGNRGPIKPTASQRRSVMRAHILNGVILSTHIKEEHGDTIKIDRLL